jgi:hypothetical protein
MHINWSSGLASRQISLNIWILSLPYYATIGRDKKGFSIIATGNKTDPVYVRGVRGSVERNAVRYYLAIQTYMDTLKISRHQRFEQRISLSTI